MSGKVKYHQLTDEEKRKFLGEFYSIMASLKSREEVKNFLKDLLTLSETVMISRRIQIAKMLLVGHTQEEIRKKLRVGFTNIAQVEKWLNNGFGGYKKALEEYENKHRNKKSGKQFREGMMKKYPFHYLLWDLVNKK